ncbi:MAG: PAS domain-containing protein [Scytonema sp. PMC 1069.18]|nr:PAS domain-containing protein [Scytonema sp. PMC 1069.18]MEC4881136.1 PAS domain-containing protein [Scytonema sp. PMC 1070.18]
MTPRVPDFRSLFEASPGLYLALTPDLTIAAVSNAYLQATMRKREEILGLLIYELFTDTSNAAAADVLNLKDSLEDVLKNQNSNTMPLGEYSIFYSKNQENKIEERYWQPVNYPIFGADGEMTYIIHCLEDVTQVVRLKQQQSEQRNEEKLQQYSDRLALAFEAARMGSWVWDLQTNELTWNPYHEILFGYESGRSNYSYQDWRDRVHPDDLPLVEAASLSAMENQQNYECEYRVIWEDGSVHWLSALGHFQYDSDGQPMRMLGVLYDITERKETEAALRQSEAIARARAEELETFMEAVPAAVWIAHDPQCHQMTANRSAYELVRMSSGAVITATPADEKYPFEFKIQRNGEDIPYNDLPMQKAGRTGQEVEEEIEFAFENDDVRFIYGKAVPLWNNVGEVRGVIGAFLDVTDRKRVEKALRESEERFRLAARAVAGLVYDWDIQTGVVQRSEGLYRLIGVHPEDDPQTLDWWKERIHPDDLSRLEPEVRSVLTGSGDRYEYEYRVRHEDGRWIDVWDRGYLIRNRNGKLVRVVGSSSDITERKQAEAERERLLARERSAREQAEVANRIKDEFLAVLSHELRSPLNPILGWSKLLQTRKFDEQTTAKALETIERNAKLQVQLIEDLLDVSRILRGKFSLDICPVDLTSTINAAIETVQLAAQTKNIQIQTEFEPGVAQVQGDAGRLQQVVWNLLSNAIKFTPSGGQVEVCLEQVNQDARIQVKDTGKGINPDFLPYVFDYFRQEDGKTTRQFGGLGLGLAIVRHITEMHGGTVCADSLGEEQGATFSISIPLMLTQSNKSQDDGINTDVSQNLRSLQGVRVLLVDDEIDTRQLIAFLLQQSGAIVTDVAAADEALATLEKYTPDILISDIGMPCVDGYMFIRQVRSLSSKQREIPAIALTAYAGEANQEQALSAGFQKHISKPVEPEKLIQAVADLIQRP